MEREEWKVLRTEVSPYMQGRFNSREKEALESIDNVRYVSSWEDRPNILITSTQSKLDTVNRELMENVRLIVHPNSGDDPFSPQFKSNFNIPIIMGNNLRSQAVAQYVMSCIFDRYVSPPFSNKWDKNRQWRRRLLQEVKILIIGFGHIGTIVSSTLSSLEADHIIYDPYKGYDRLPDIENIDTIVLSCSYNDYNKGFINDELMRNFKSDVTIINAARGKLIEESALIHFLKQNEMAAAYLDVFESEPYCNQKFINIPNAFLTSHIAGVYTGLEQAILDFELNAIQNFVSLSH